MIACFAHMLGILSVGADGDKRVGVWIALPPSFPTCQAANHPACYLP